MFPSYLNATIHCKTFFFRYGRIFLVFSGLQEIEDLYFNARPMNAPLVKKKKQ